MAGARKRLLDDSTGAGLAVIVGLVLAIQGFGSAIAVAIWESDWGLLAVAREHWRLPGWAAYALGGTGLLVAGGGWVWRKVVE
ncbi:hypothetical protein FZ103_21675 [Streptomonospora sp. PA3]|uniref:hypothetical protein n=1 Tax=Streptomonospora sp. PA3 TaxID=2607326 RepID=UPI0012DEEE01|nr:hypothetical protein [Streptomonospora sp. PA3]MUL43741.1 hypothetical protein [Streptomonospora sp. PA3]